MREAPAETRAPINTIGGGVKPATVSPSFEDEPELTERVAAGRALFAAEYKEAPEVVVRAPGRAEWIGNHTDYNRGFALGGPISRSILGFFGPRRDGLVKLCSSVFPRVQVTFALDDQRVDSQQRWSNYARAVICRLRAEGCRLQGLNILLTSNLPFSGGNSSSAAVEAAYLVGLLELNGIVLERMRAAHLCQQAENGPLVNSPCGFLDQACVFLGERRQAVLLDFSPHAGLPASARSIPANLAEQGYSLVITVDPEVKRNLGDSGYPERRRMCESSLPILGKLLGRKIDSLREVAVAEFETAREKLTEQGGDIMRRRVEHVIYENARVHEAVAALARADLNNFGATLTESGRSALTLYDLAAGTPELSFLVKSQWANAKIVGARNMGGGFSAVSLALLRTADLDGFQRELGGAYQKKWGRTLSFIPFAPTNGVERLE